MAKQERERRRQAQRARRAAGAVAEVADRADRGVAALVEGIGQFAAIRGKRVKSFDLEGFASLRDSFIRRGYRWPAWCFLPAPLVGAGLGEELAVDVNPALISPATMLATLAAAWTPGRIAVRFDDDVAQALMDTPMEASIPTEVLQRLPAWGLYVDCPRLGAGAGFFVTLDAGTVTGPGGQGYTELDELLVAVVRGGDDGQPLVISSLWLRPGATIGESLAEQAGQTQRLGPNFGEAGDEEWVAAIGMGRAEATARILSLVLYLCSDDSDVTRREVPTAASSRRARGGAETVVMSAGFRLGAALRLAAAEHASAAGDGTGHRVAPHLRRAHWHHFWAGSEYPTNQPVVTLTSIPVALTAEVLSMAYPERGPQRQLGDRRFSDAKDGAGDREVERPAVIATSGSTGSRPYGSTPTCRTN